MASDTAQDLPIAPGKAEMDLYHVTYSSNVSGILRTGIQPGKSPVWFKKGLGLFPQGFIFAFTDYQDATGWALRQNCHTERDCVIFTFDADRLDWISDECMEGVARGSGEWIKSRKIVLAGSILLVTCQAQWLADLRESGADAVLPPRDKLSLWKWLCATCSNISELLILPYDGPK